MADVECDVWVGAPLERVFGWLSDPVWAPRWLPGLESLEALGEGPVGLGSRFRGVRRGLGVVVRAELEVVEWSPPERYVGVARGLGAEAWYGYRLAEEGGGTRVWLEAELRVGPLTRLARPVLRRLLEAVDGDQLRGLVELAEEEVSEVARGRGSGVGGR